MKTFKYLSNNQKVKDLLEGYWYDYLYLLEKSNEIEKVKSLLDKSLTRLSQFKEYDYQIEGLENQMDLILQKQANEEESLLTIMRKKQNLEYLIRELPEPYSIILYLKYICFKTFDYIAEKLSYSTVRIYQLHKEAVDLLSEKYEKSIL